MGGNNIRRKILGLFVCALMITEIVPVIGSETIQVYSDINRNNNSKLILNDDNKKENWIVIICGGASDKQATMFTAGAEPIRNSAKHAYDMFKNLGYDDDHIYYLNDRDISAEGVDDLVNGLMVNYAITEWLATRSDYNDNCCIYIAGHGSRRNYVAVWNNASQQYEHIYADVLGMWIDNLNYNICTIIIDSCHSGGFIRSLTKNNRIIITSTSWLLWSYGIKEACFSYHFFNKLAENVSYGEAWEYADKQLLFMQTPDSPNAPLILRLFVKIGISFFENPKLDDNGDGIGYGRVLKVDKLQQGFEKINKFKDGRLALNTFPK